MASNILGQTRLSYARAWHLVNLSSEPRPLGRVATQIATVLMGKHKPTWNPSTDCGDYVVVTGCKDLHVTGKKRQQKTYWSHNTRPGSLKTMTLEKMQAKWGGGEILKRAVRGMLPKNRLRDDRMARLRCFEGPDHPFKGNIIKVSAQSRSSPLSIRRKDASADVTPATSPSSTEAGQAATAS